MKRFLALIGIISTLTFACTEKVALEVTPSDSDLQFDQLSKVWDEAVPLGNATLGALVWQRDSVLRFSLDRTDLWDLRPLKGFSGPKFRFGWIYDQVQKGDYRPVQKLIDDLYIDLPAPSKIPGAALEFPTRMGKVASVRLFLHEALCEVTWENGAVLKTFVHATEPVGWFEFENLPDTLSPQIVAPRYNDPSLRTDRDYAQSLGRLGYEQGKILNEAKASLYHQDGWGGFSYDVSVRWQRSDAHSLRGVWSVTSSSSEDKAQELTSEAMQRGLTADYQTHTAFWKDYWAQSSVSLPDPVLQKQYDNEMYKFGSAAHEDSYPISLQAVWTADDGTLPPWKGDFHHDLNTQMSYWPTYTGNHLKEGMSFLNTLWNQREVYKKYTRQFFETEGMNIPGVCTLAGEPLGGWAQYSMSPTVSAWLAQYFYLHWKYSADRDFLQQRAYPFLKDVVTFLEAFSSVNAEGLRTLPLSSSPEIFDNSIKAWFKDMTNYDISLMKFAFNAASEMASELSLPAEAEHWKALGDQLPELSIDEDGALAFAKGFPYNESHRHFSHAMSIHPLSLIDWSQGEQSQKIIRATIKKLDDYGPDLWTGFSYSWLGNLKARAFDGEGAVEALRIFAQCFCLPNTFHANGDQSRTGKSKFDYRPFTLEGNFAFAAGIQEMLLQSHTGVIRVFPAVPESWGEVSFDKFRAMGAFLVSARMVGGKVREVRIFSEQGGTLKFAIPEGCTLSSEDFTTEDGILTLKTTKGQTITLQFS